MYYVYVLVEETEREVYVGFTSDLRRRVEEHQSGHGAEYTKNGTWRLAYYEAFFSECDARTREKKLKHDGRSRYQLYARMEKSLCGQK